MTTNSHLLELRKKILEDEFSHLNKEQRDAVFSNGGPLLILAGAGSGKTTTVISKIGYLIRYGNSYTSEYINADESDTGYLEQCLNKRSMRSEARYTHTIYSLLLLRTKLPEKCVNVLNGSTE